MASIPKDLKYVKSHEWVRFEDGGRARMGITDFAQESLGDLVYIELPRVGDEFSRGENIAVVESVKATSDIYAPVGGRVSAVNTEMEDHPEMVNEDSYGAWLVELEDIAADACGGLLTAEEYEQAVLSEMEGE